MYNFIMSEHPCHTYSTVVLWGSMTYLEGFIKCQAQSTCKSIVIHIYSTTMIFMKQNVITPLSQDHWSNILRHLDTRQELGYKHGKPLCSCTSWHEPMHLPHNEATRSSNAQCVFLQAVLTSFIIMSGFTKQKQTKTQEVIPLTLAKSNI